MERKCLIVKEKDDTKALLYNFLMTFMPKGMKKEGISPEGRSSDCTQYG